MVKFKLTVPIEKAITLTNRVVCDVLEIRTNTPILGKMVNWRGSVNEEYFSILFFKGILVVSLEERECRLGQDSVNYAMTESLDKAISGAPADDAVARTDASFDYYLKVSPKESDEISFTDVMVALYWKYAPNAKIDYDLLAV